MLLCNSFYLLKIKSCSHIKNDMVNFLSIYKERYIIAYEGNEAVYSRLSWCVFPYALFNYLPLIIAKNNSNKTIVHKHIHYLLIIPVLKV